MRHAFLLDSLEHGGAEFSTLQLAAWLRTQGEEALLYTLKEPTSSWIPTNSALESPNIIGSGSMARQALRLRSELLHSRPDVLNLVLARSSHVGRVAAATLPRISRPLVASWFVSDYLGRAHRGRLGAARTSYLYLLERATLALVPDGRSLAVSSSTAQAVARRLGLEYVAVIGRGRSALTSPGLPDMCAAGARDEFQVLAVGRQVEVKQFDLLPRALAVLSERARSNYRLTFLGRSGDGTSVLTNCLHPLPRDSWRIVGEVAAEEVARSMLQADVLVCTSRAEGFPNVVLEAYAQGLAVIAPRSKFMSDLGDPGVHYLDYDQGSPESLADTLEQARRSARLRHMVEAQARGLFLKQYTPGAVTNRYLAAVS